jgi:uncharacterized low-complexity protein
MNSKSKLKPVALAVGAAFATTLAMSPVANAVENPFAMTQLHAGYKLADNKAEGNCGANKAKAKEANCGANKAKQEKAKEANCGANKAKQEKAKEGNCGANKAK